MIKILKQILKMIFYQGYLIELINQKKTTKKFSNNKVYIGLRSTFKNSHLGYKSYITRDVKLENVKLGDYSIVTSNTDIKNADIGKFCSIGSNINIGMGYHPLDFVSTHFTFYANNKHCKTFSNELYVKDEIKKTIIGNDVFIGTGVYIPGGIIIGDGSVIAAGAVVTKDVAPYSLVGGIPAKLIKYRFSTDQIKKLEMIKWWDFDEKFFKENYKLFHEIEEFISFFSNN